MSRIGKRPVELPSGVTASVSGQTVEVKGPKGTRSFTATDDVTLAVADGAVTVTPRGSSKRAASSAGSTGPRRESTRRARADKPRRLASSTVASETGWADGMTQ